MEYPGQLPLPHAYSSRVDGVCHRLCARRPSDTLKACALTCRDLLPRSRTHLHRVFTVRRMGPDPSRKLQAVPAMAWCTRKVVIVNGMWGHPDISVLSGLDRVDQLQLGYSNFERQQLGNLLLSHEPLPSTKRTRQVTAAEFPRFPRLKELRIEWDAVCAKADLLPILKCIPHLTTLHVDLTDGEYVEDGGASPILYRAYTTRWFRRSLFH